MLQLLRRFQSQGSFLQLREVSVARKKVVNILSHAKPPGSNLQPEQLKALKSLKNNDSILVLPDCCYLVSSPNFPRN